MMNVEMLTCPACDGTGRVPDSYPRPRTIELHRDLGWLAVSPQGYRWPVGVEGATEQEAIQKWYVAAQRWERLGREKDEARLDEEEK